MEGIEIFSCFYALHNIRINIRPSISRLSLINQPSRQPCFFSIILKICIFNSMPDAPVLTARTRRVDKRIKGSRCP